MRYIGVRVMTFWTQLYERADAGQGRLAILDKSFVFPVILAVCGLLVFSAPASFADGTENNSAALPGASNGIGYPAGWQTWPAIGVSHRTDNNTVRLILGNPVAVEAARTGATNPWPDGAIIGKVVWKAEQLQHWPSAIAPEKFVHAEFMFRDSGKFSDTYGWGWARWVGLSQVPFDEGPQSCIGCHTPVKDRHWVFTEPATFPDPGHQHKQGANQRSTGQ
jgi:hypothetical protein